MSEKTASAYLKSVKSSPLKAMKIAGAIKRMPVSKALDVLQFSKLKLASVFRSLVYSAMSNAENNHNLDVDNLYIEKIDIGRSYALRRFRARGRGKSGKIIKTFSNIRVTLAEMNEDIESKKEKNINNNKKEKAKAKAKVKKDNASSENKEAKEPQSEEKKSQPKKG